MHYRKRDRKEEQIPLAQADSRKNRRYLKPVKKFQKFLFTIEQKKGVAKSGKKAYRSGAKSRSDPYFPIPGATGWENDSRASPERRSSKPTHSSKEA